MTNQGHETSTLSGASPAPHAGGRGRLSSAAHEHAPAARAASSAGRPALSSGQWIVALGLASSLLSAVAFPPIGFAPAVWLAPIGLVLLVRQDRLGDAGSLSGRHPYLALWVTGLVFWLVAAHWLRLPHWAGYFSWMGLAALMACYVPLFVGLSRVLVHRVGLSVIVAAPVIWTGLELCAPMFPMASRWPACTMPTIAG